MDTVLAAARASLRRTLAHSLADDLAPSGLGPRLSPRVRFVGDEKRLNDPRTASCRRAIPQGLALTARETR